MPGGGWSPISPRRARPCQPTSRITPLELLQVLGSAAVLLADVLEDLGQDVDLDGRQLDASVHALVVDHLVDYP